MIGTVVRRLALAVFVAIGVGTILLVGFLLRGGVQRRPSRRRPKRSSRAACGTGRSRATCASGELLAGEAGDRRREGRAHFADHCALCHANDGGWRHGDGHGRSIRERPNMRRPETQALSDGELFAIIKNGVRVSTGMPAWGNDDPASDEAQLQKPAHFIRHLPVISLRLSFAEMQELNPEEPKRGGKRSEEDANSSKGTDSG